jgi:hypothetical protein
MLLDDNQIFCPLAILRFARPPRNVPNPLLNLLRINLPYHEIVSCQCLPKPTDPTDPSPPRAAFACGIGTCNLVASQ